MRLAPQFETSLSRRILTLFVVLLITGIGFVQSVHLHDDLAPSGPTRSHCALCVFSHSPAVVTAARTAPIVATNFRSPQAQEPQLRSRLMLPSFSIRPPPVI
jgi:hypothetical protein